MYLTRVESRESYPVPERPHYIMKLSSGTATFFIQGREMKEDEVGDTLIRLINAINAVEHQVDVLYKALNSTEIHIDHLEDYLDEFPEEENYKRKYKIEDVKDAIFHAMMKKDEKQVSKWLNQLSVLEEKLKLKGEEQ